MAVASREGARARWRRVVLLVVGASLLVLVNWLCTRWRAQLDWTDDRVYSLTEGTRDLLHELDDPVRATAYFGSLPPRFAEAQGYVSNMLAGYADASGGTFTFRVVDPSGDRALQAELREAGIEPTHVIELSGDEQVQRRAFFAVTLEQNDQLELWQPRDARFAVEALEYELTTRLQRLAGGRPKVGITHGFGEPLQTQVLMHPESKFAHWDITPVDWKAAPSELGGVDALVVNGPTEPVSPETRRALEEFVGEGKPVLFLVGGIAWGPGGDAVPGQDVPYLGVPAGHGLGDLLARFGFVVEAATVIDAENSVQGLVPIGQPPLLTRLFFPLTEAVATDRYEPLEGLELVPLAFVSPITTTDPVPGVTRAPLLRTFSTSLGHPGALSIGRDPTALDTSSMAHGPFTVAWTAEGTMPVTEDRTSPPGTRVVVVGSSAFISDDTFVTMRKLRSEALVNGFEAFAGMLSWALVDTTLARARGKTVSRPLRAVSAEKRAALKWGLTVGLPVAIGALGLALSLLRRRRARHCRW